MLKLTRANLTHIISVVMGLFRGVNNTFDEVYENLEGIDGRVDALFTQRPYVKSGVLYLTTPTDPQAASIMTAATEETTKGD